MNKDHSQYGPQQDNHQDNHLVLPDHLTGAADPSFAWAVQAFARLFPKNGFGAGGGALAVYLDGTPVVDVWAGWADRARTVPWSADTGTMVFSATKGMASTVIHRLADRGLIDYDTPVAHYWPEFGANGKSQLTVRDVMSHRAGLSHLHGVSTAELMDHRLMERRLAAAVPLDQLLGKSAYHALTYGWLMAGLARAVTGKGMRELIRIELAAPLGADGLHLGRPPAGAPTRAAELLAPQVRLLTNRIAGPVLTKAAGWRRSNGLGAMYFPGIETSVRGDMPLLDTELPAGNGVATARALARMYGAIAHGGKIDQTRFLSAELTAGLTGRRSLRLDHNIYFPVSFHLGYHAVPIRGVMPGFGHAGLGGSIGWADPASGLAFGFVHNRLRLSTAPVDASAFLWLNALIRRGAALARARGYQPVTDFGAPFTEPETRAG